MIFALVGNQNCGKTTLFNQLTGSNQHVGNFPGVTVDSKEGVMRGAKGQLMVLNKLAHTVFPILPIVQTVLRIVVTDKIGRASCRERV